MTDTTARLALPLIAPGQAQKEMTHNEALTMIDIALNPSVVAIGLDVPPAAPVAGQCWIVGASPSGAWTGQARAIAGWTAGGWRFVVPRAGTVATLAETGRRAMFLSGEWRTDTAPPPVADPAGGNVVDVQARSAIAQLLSALRGLQLIPPNM